MFLYLAIPIRTLTIFMVILSLQSTGFAGQFSPDQELWSQSTKLFEDEDKAVPATRLLSLKSKLGSNPLNRVLSDHLLNDYYEFPGSNSFKLKWLESPGDLRSNWLAHVKSEVSPLSFAPDIQNIQNIITSKYKFPLQKEKRELGALRFEIIKPAWDKNDQLVLKNTEDKSEQVIASDKLFFPNSVDFKGLSLSPDKTKLSFIASLNGSIDNTFLVIYDIVGQKILRQFEINGASIIWRDSQTLIAASPYSNSVGWATEIFYLDGQAPQVYLRTVIEDYGSSWLGTSVDGDENIEFVHRKDSGKILTLKKFHDGTTLTKENFIDEDDQYFYFKADELGASAGAIFRLKLEPLSVPEKIIPENTWVLENAWLNGEDFFLVTSFKGQSALRIVHKSNLTQLFQMSLPTCCVLIGADWETPAKESLKLTFKNILSDTKDLLVNTKEPLPSDQLQNQLQEELIANSTLALDVELKFIESFDGYMVPITMIKKRNLPLDGQRPVYMETYGGFNSSGYLQMPLSKIKLEFVKNGGVYVGTGVRGGNESGASGYFAAIKDRKLTSIKDLIAVAQGLIKLGVTQSEKIVSFGASNGGFVVASAGRLSPESFGLVIPMNGVHDQLGFSKMDRWGLSWSADYGDTQNSLDFRAIMNRSPLEIPQKTQGSCQFLIVSGENDTRVNKIHSYKLKAIMDEYYPGRALLLSADHSGHGAMTDKTQKGVETASQVWSYIFKFSKITL
ncbi:MAG: S9 family peptidase [Bdellovibrionaceae bacterium]|nr:S9 family peptidase [Pseudobdellovibrionaceae bacterium]